MESTQTIHLPRLPVGRNCHAPAIRAANSTCRWRTTIVPGVLATTMMIAADVAAETTRMIAIVIEAGDGMMTMMTTTAIATEVGAVAAMMMTTLTIPD